MSGEGLRRAVLGSGAIKALQLLLGIGSSLLLARLLGPGGYGAYAFALAFATLLAIPAQLGWPTLLTREVARFQHDQDPAQLKGVLRTSGRWVAVSAVVTVFAGLAIGIGIGSARPDIDTTMMLVACVLIPLVAWIGLRAAALRGLDRVLVAQLLDGLLRPGLFLLCIAAVYLGGALTPVASMSAQVLATLATLIVGSLVLRRVLPSALSEVCADNREVDAWRRSLWPLMFVSSAQVVVLQADLFVLGLVSDARAIGIYKVGVMIGTQVGFATWLVNAVFAARIVRLHRAGDTAGLRLLMRQGVRYVMAIALPAAIGIVVLGRPVLDLFLGAEYREAYWPMVIVAVGQLLGVTAGPVGILLGMTGHERDVAKVLVITTTISVVLTGFLASAFGAIGAALATATAFVLTRLLLKRVVSIHFPYLASSWRLGA